MDTDSDNEPMFPYNPENDSSSVFNYEDQLLSTSFSIAILESNIESIKAQIESGKDINMLNKYGNTPLHAAVVQKSIDTLNLLLQLPDINLNFKNYMGDTPLLLSMKMRQPDSFIMHLLEAGCDINIANNVEETPLHRAVARTSTCIALELIKRGADINALDGNKYTPLHQAVVCGNLEMVCMLLYYNADVSMTCFHNLTPFMYAANDIDKLEIAKVLFNYYADFSTVSTDGFSPLLLAANSRSPIAVDIANVATNVNMITPQGNSVVLFALHYDNSDLFKTVWPKFDHQNLLHSSSDLPFLLAFLLFCHYPTSEWVECIYDILNSTLIRDLLADCTEYVKPCWSFFSNLISTMFDLKVGLTDRLTIIQICLSFGAAVFIHDINRVLELYGYKEELEIFIQFCTISKIDHNHCNSYFLLPTFIFALEDSCSTECIVKLFENQIRLLSRPESDPIRRDILRSLEFFSFPYKTKQTKQTNKSKKFCANMKDVISTKYNVIPEHPSLVELSRNAVRRTIKKNHKIKMPYQFYTAVNNLNIPTLIKNIILFKSPIY